MTDSKSLLQLVVAALISGAVVSTVAGILFRGYLTQVETTVKSQRQWKERSVEELLAPISMPFDRTQRAFNRWRSHNLYVEAKVIKVGNETIRDLLLTKGHLIPPDLRQDAGLLVEHYDVWLEKFEKQRLAEDPDLESPFIFVGPDGFPFPREAEKKFREKLREYWDELYRSSSDG